MKSINEAMKEFELNESKNPLVNPDRKDKKIEEAKSAEASMVLRLMDSVWNDELSFQKLVDIISIATGTDKKKLAKELDQYV